MLDLSPTKIIIILVVVVVLLGPKRLPEVARQLGAGWRKVREYHRQFDHELRQTIPDLPTSQEIVRFARSPVALLNQLADRQGEPSKSEGGAGLDRLDGDGSPSGSGSGSGSPAPEIVHGPRMPRRPEGAAGSSGLAFPALTGLDADDPNLN